MTSFADRARTSEAARCGAGGKRMHRPVPHAPRPPWAPVQRMESPRSASTREESGPAAAPNRTGLPDALRAGVEALSGLAMDDVRVHRDSPEPVKLGALAYTQGSNIHLGPGQEEHLPHEAWHVVQQKQGRVQTTTQMKGEVRVNDDPGLEREADRMGERVRESGAAASASPGGAGTTAVAAASSGAPIQRKLIQNGAAVSRPWFASTFSRISAIVDQYLAADATYVMRNDCQLTDVTIHLIESDKKYLLGEEHDSNSWAQRTANWTVDTMQEGESAIGNTPPAQGGPVSPRKLAQPLEESLYVTLASATSAQALLNQSLPVGQNGAALADSSNNKLHSKVICGSLKNIMQKWGPQFKTFYTSRKYEDLTSVRDILLWTFSKVLDETWAPKLAALHNAVAAQTKPNPDLADIGQKIAANRGALAELTGSAMAAAKAGADAQVAANSAQEVATFSTAQAGGLLDAVRAVSPLREAAMIRNIRAARAPLFVQIGNEHLANVAAGVGNTAVAVDKDADFQAVTRKP
ncbi:MAG TPA: DUF4157 domain-containing protein [Allosphingosinicella sp.]|jgi:hypothetical protein